MDVPTVARPFGGGTGEWGKKEDERETDRRGEAGKEGRRRGERGERGSEEKMSGIVKGTERTRKR